MSEIPCKANKCISYPVCLHKSILDCQDLYDWVAEMAPNKDFTWSYIRARFEQATRIIEPGSMNVGYNENTVFPYPLKEKYL